MMKKKYLLLWSVALFVSSCSDETTIFSDPKDDYQLENSQLVLENSVIYDNAGVLDIFEETNISGKYPSSGKVVQAGDYPLTLVAQINPPSYSGGENLTASHVHVDGNYAYVSYNTVEEVYAGAIDVIDVSDPTQPLIASRLYYDNMDINSIEYNDGYIYVVGGMDSEKSITATSNSFVAKIPVSVGVINVGAGITYGFQQGFNGTDVEVTASSVIVSSGGDGSISVYDKRDMSLINESFFADLRSVSFNNEALAVLDASKGVSILDNNLNIIREIGIDTDFGSGTKRTLEYRNDKIVVSEGPKGAGLYDANSGAFLEYLPILIDPNATNIQDSETNAVAINEEILLMANGGAGLSLSEYDESNTGLFGVIQLEGSINYVESKEDYIFAASGKRGLQIIKLNRPSESLAASCVSLPGYSGSTDMNVRLGEDEAYKGAKRFANIEVAGSLLLCGSWTVSNAVDVYDDSLFEMKGTLVIGKNSKRKNVIVHPGATFKVEGDLTIYGNLIVSDGAILEFVGNGSVVNIFGTVIQGDTSLIYGNFDDVKNKF